MKSDASVRTIRVELAGCTLVCDIIGDGAPVVFAHGYLLTGEMWRGVVGRLGDGWRAIVPDLRGHGRGGASNGKLGDERGDASGDASMARHADDLAAILDALGESRPVVIVGLSMGGIIAFEFFRRHRRRVRALVLADTRPNGEGEKGRAYWEDFAQRIERQGSKVAADEVIDRAFGPDLDPAVRAHWYDIICDQSPVGLAAGARALGVRPDSWPTLPRIDCPTLVMVGAQDVVTPPELARRMHAAIPAARFALIENAGHVSPVEQPEAFADALRTFLAELPPCFPFARTASPTPSIRSS